MTRRREASIAAAIAVLYAALAVFAPAFFTRENFSDLFLGNFPVLLAAMALGARVCLDHSHPDYSNRPDARVVLAGMLGAGLLQFLMVAAGYFPGWATGPPHLCALWWLTILAFSIWMFMITVFDAVERQLGLKLVTRKQSVPVIVVDHVDEKPLQ